MVSKDYLKLCEEAQRKKLRLAKKQEKQIKQIYNDMYLNLSKKISKTKPGSVTEEYLTRLQKELEKEIIKVNKDISLIIKKNTKQSSELASNTQLDFFMSIIDTDDLDIKSTFSSMFAKIPQEAVNEILGGKVYKDGKGLAERLWQSTVKFNKDIDYIIAEGIANKKSVYEVAKDLEKYVNPNEAKDWDWKKVYPKSNKVVDYNAQRLARTSINHAFQQAQKRSCMKNPYVEGIKWISADIHERTCQLCKDRASQDNYGLGPGVYPVKESPLDHANGMCSTIPYITKSLEDIGRELNEWTNGKENTKLDEWFKKFGGEFI